MQKLKLLRRRWKIGGLFYCGLLAVAMALPVTMGLHLLWGWPLWVGVLVLGVVFGGMLRVVPMWRVGLADVAVYLDRTVPELEDSCGLLLRPVDGLNGLERLQAARVSERLERVVLPRPFYGRLLRACGWLGLAMVGSVVLGAVGRTSVAKCQVKVGVRPVVRVEAGVASVNVRITPPAYTGKTLRRQENLNLQVEEGAAVSWEIKTNVPIDTVCFVFNDSARWRLQPDETRTVWRLSRLVQQAGFYQLVLGAKPSDLYKLEVIKDEPPKIVIRTPKAYTVIDYGEPEQVSLTAKITDDYGIAAGSIVATVASGKGEAVKFKEQEISWGRTFSGERECPVKHILDLPAMGLKPGDELYLYCKARDSHGQEVRTDTYILSLADTAQLMSLQGMTMATDVKPEFFRSERQIIIETEQLLSQQDTLPAAAFNNRSNDLGIDQKLLRLRYGKFLGEEAEEGEGVADTADMGKFGDATKILDAFTDKHDNAEDATFFEPAVKQQLKATLSEMWNAELRLRTFKPREALPYCYKALRLLKDLQQQSRAYVAKTGVKLTPLNPAKRLTGELAAIAAPRQQVAKAAELSDADELRMGLAVLEELRSGGVPGIADRMVLSAVERRMGAAAAARPGRFLAGYSELKKIVDGVGGDVVSVEKAIGALLPAVEDARPVVREGAADGGLSKLYFSYLR